MTRVTVKPGITGIVIAASTRDDEAVIAVSAGDDEAVIAVSAGDDVKPSLPA